MSTLQNGVNQKLDQWSYEAMIALARHGREGGKFNTKVWANGQTMVTPITEWATGRHAVPRDIAVQIFKNNWVIPNHLIPDRWFRSVD